MKIFYLYIALLGICSYTLYNGFNNPKQGARSIPILEMMYSIGFTSFIILFIASFFFIRWWHVILLFAATAYISPLIAPKRRIIVIELFSLVGVIVFSILAWVGMLSK